jgi:hypothetical protein
VSEYVGQAFVTEPDGDEAEVRASLRGDDQDWGGYLIGPADWIVDRVEHRTVLRAAPPRRSHRGVLRERLRLGQHDAADHSRWRRDGAVHLAASRVETPNQWHPVEVHPIGRCCSRGTR